MLFFHISIPLNSNFLLNNELEASVCVVIIWENKGGNVDSLIIYILAAITPIAIYNSTTNITLDKIINTH